MSMHYSEGPGVFSICAETGQGLQVLAFINRASPRSIALCI